MNKVIIATIALMIVASAASAKEFSGVNTGAFSVGAQTGTNLQTDTGTNAKVKFRLKRVIRNGHNRVVE